MSTNAPILLVSDDSDDDVIVTSYKESKSQQNVRDNLKADPDDLVFIASSKPKTTRKGNPALLLSLPSFGADRMTESDDSTQSDTEGENTSSSQTGAESQQDDSYLVTPPSSPLPVFKFMQSDKTEEQTPVAPEVESSESPVNPYSRNILDIDSHKAGGILDPVNHNSGSILDTVSCESDGVPDSVNRESGAIVDPIIDSRSGRYDNLSVQAGTGELARHDDINSPKQDERHVDQSSRAQPPNTIFQNFESSLTADLKVTLNLKRRPSSHSRTNDTLDSGYKSPKERLVQDRLSPTAADVDNMMDMHLAVVPRLSVNELSSTDILHSLNEKEANRSRAPNSHNRYACNRSQSQPSAALGAPPKTPPDVSNTSFNGSPLSPPSTCSNQNCDDDDSDSTVYQARFRLSLSTDYGDAISQTMQTVHWNSGRNSCRDTVSPIPASVHKTVSNAMASPNPQRSFTRGISLDNQEHSSTFEHELSCLPNELIEKSRSTFDDSFSTIDFSHIRGEDSSSPIRPVNAAEDLRTRTGLLQDPCEVQSAVRTLRKEMGQGSTESSCSSPKLGGVSSPLAHDVDRNESQDKAHHEQNSNQNVDELINHFQIINDPVLSHQNDNKSANQSHDRDSDRNSTHFRNTSLSEDVSKSFNFSDFDSDMNSTLDPSMCGTAEGDTDATGNSSYLNQEFLPSRDDKSGMGSSRRQSPAFSRGSSLLDSIDGDEPNSDSENSDDNDQTLDNCNSEQASSPSFSGSAKELLDSSQDKNLIDKSVFSSTSKKATLKLQRESSTRRSLQEWLREGGTKEDSGYKFIYNESGGLKKVVRSKSLNDYSNDRSPADTIGNDNNGRFSRNARGRIPSKPFMPLFHAHDSDSEHSSDNGDIFPAPASDGESEESDDVNAASNASDTDVIGSITDDNGDVTFTNSTRSDKNDSIDLNTSPNKTEVTDYCYSSSPNSTGSETDSLLGPKDNLEHTASSVSSFEPLPSPLSSLSSISVVNDDTNAKLFHKNSCSINNDDTNQEHINQEQDKNASVDSPVDYEKSERNIPLNTNLAFGSNSSPVSNSSPEQNAETLMLSQNGEDNSHKGSNYDNNDRVLKKKKKKKKHRSNQDASFKSKGKRKHSHKSKKHRKSEFSSKCHKKDDHNSSYKRKLSDVIPRPPVRMRLWLDPSRKKFRKENPNEPFPHPIVRVIEPLPNSDTSPADKNQTSLISHSHGNSMKSSVNAEKRLKKKKRLLFKNKVPYITYLPPRSEGDASQSNSPVNGEKSPGKQERLIFKRKLPYITYKKSRSDRNASQSKKRKDSPRGAVSESNSDEEDAPRPQHSMVERQHSHTSMPFNGSESPRRPYIEIVPESCMRSPDPAKTPESAETPESPETPETPRTSGSSSPSHEISSSSHAPLSPSSRPSTSTNATSQLSSFRPWLGHSKSTPSRRHSRGKMLYEGDKSPVAPLIDKNNKTYHVTVISSDDDDIDDDVIIVRSEPARKQQSRPSVDKQRTTIATTTSDKQPSARDTGPSMGSSFDALMDARNVRTPIPFSSRASPLITAGPSSSRDPTSDVAVLQSVYGHDKQTMDSSTFNTAQTLSSGAVNNDATSLSQIKPDSNIPLKKRKVSPELSRSKSYSAGINTSFSSSVDQDTVNFVLQNLNGASTSQSSTISDSNALDLSSLGGPNLQPSTSAVGSVDLSSFPSSSYLEELKCFHCGFTRARSLLSVCTSGHYCCGDCLQLQAKDVLLDKNGAKNNLSKFIRINDDSKYLVDEKLVIRFLKNIDNKAKTHHMIEVKNSAPKAIQGLINGSIEPYQFCSTIDLYNGVKNDTFSAAMSKLASVLPKLRCRLLSGSVSIEGFSPPPMHNVYLNILKSINSQRSPALPWSLYCKYPQCDSSFALSELRKTLPDLVVTMLQEKLEKSMLEAASDNQGNDGEEAKDDEDKKDEKSNSEYPEDWWPPDEKVEYQVFPLHQDCEEFAVVMALFHDSMHQPRAQITGIKRVQNPTQWKFYRLHKEKMIRQNGTDDVERRLFHGTSNDVVDAICRDNFDWRMSGKHGTVLGQGSYFARDASYSHRYTDNGRVGAISHMIHRRFPRGNVTTQAFQRMISSFPGVTGINPPPGHSFLQIPGPQLAQTSALPSNSMPPMSGPTPMNQPIGPTPMNQPIGPTPMNQPIGPTPMNQPIGPGSLNQSGGPNHMGQTGANGQTVGPPLSGSTHTFPHPSNPVSIGPPWQNLPPAPQPLVSVTTNPSGMFSVSGPQPPPAHSSAPSAPSNLSHAQQGACSMKRYTKHTMFLARVLVGMYCRGQGVYKKPPALPGDTAGRTFNSCVDDINNPSIFVVFDHAQSYPEYIIEYNNELPGQ